MKQIRWVDDIVAAFLTLPKGLRSLPEIYHTVTTIRRSRGLIMPNFWDSCIREKLQQYSSDCPHHWTPKHPDYFYSGGMHTGLWGLRNSAWLKELALLDTITNFNFLNQHAALISAKDPRVGVRVVLYQK